MNNVRQFPSQVVAPPPAVFVSPELKPFAVSFRFTGHQEVVNVLAFTSCDAICSAIDLLFDGDIDMPVGNMVVSADPIEPASRAA